MFKIEYHESPEDHLTHISRRHLYRCVSEVKAYVGKNKNKFTKKLPILGIEPGTSCDPLSCH